jgi:hypothetical protein
MEPLGKHFLLHSAHLLRDDFLPKIKEAVSLLSEEEIWLRAGDASNSVGNLLMHLAGNVRQHIVGGVGGAPDVRNRRLEFAARGGVTCDVLLGDLHHAVIEACHILENLDPALLSERRVIQGKEVLLFDDVFHVVEHFSYHTGQIVLMVKALRQRGFDWWKHLDL